MSTHAWQPSAAFDLGRRPRASASFFTGLCVATALLALIAVSATRPANVSTSEPALAFVENAGQENAAVRYAAHASGASFFFMRKEAVLAFERGDKGLALRLGFVGANPAPEIEGESARAGTVNYLVGSDASEWRTKIPRFGEVVYRDLWPGIDMVFRGAKGTLKYEFVVAPGADPSRIGLTYRGADRLVVGSAGVLLIDTPFGTLRDEKPRSFQSIDGRRVPVESRFALGERAGSYGFALGGYDASRPLVIDPGLLYSSYLGGAEFDEARNVALGADGSMYVTGATTSADFPSTAGPFDPARDGPSDGFVTKFDTDGSLVYSTFIGGSAPDNATGLAVDRSGSAYVVGWTDSSDFPTTPGALDTSFGTSQDGFVTKLASDGSALVYSTYLGGFENTAAVDVALGADGSAFVVGSTRLFPTTPGAFDETADGSEDGFVARLAANGSALLYATYLGGSNCDLESPSSVAVDANGSAYVAGYTSADDFPTTPGAFDTTGEGCTDFGLDGYVTKVNPSGSALLYSTFLNGESNLTEFAFGIDVDASGNAYVTGATQSPDFPTTAGAYDGTFGGSDPDSGLPDHSGMDAFVAKLNAAGSDLVFSTFLGGRGPENGTAVAVGAGGDVFVSGGSSSDDFPTTPGAFDESHNGGDDAILARLDASGSTLLYGTYFGGSGHDYGLWGVAVDAGGRALFSGYTDSSDLPMSPNAFDNTYGGGEHQQDGWVAKLATEVERSAAERIDDAISRLEGLTTPRNRDKLEDVIEKLDKALAKLAQSPPDRQGAAGELEGAVGDVDAAVRSGLLSRADGDAVMTEIAEAARVLAEEAIADAQGGNAAKLAEAQAALAAGDSRLAAGRFKAAVAMYKDAISKAEGA
jgi:hypothetical protein